ncbi:hypothetical protein ZHAS_00009416 [Anopheles sinensis]|uniref:Uncharacterized protein n=1 Tax=Anopheles sinensis TaxID=74873 RepID=A0A084VUX8_ANOSI|nr:hypothetical protein ZHAS_00009416 [Anopheles sinensis]
MHGSLRAMQLLGGSARRCIPALIGQLAVVCRFSTCHGCNSTPTAGYLVRRSLSSLLSLLGVRLTSSKRTLEPVSGPSQPLATNCVNWQTARPKPNALETLVIAMTYLLAASYRPAVVLIEDLACELRYP